MPSKSQDDTQDSKRLPFEPKGNRKKGEKKSSPSGSDSASNNESSDKTKSGKASGQAKSAAGRSPRAKGSRSASASGSSGIPEAVSRRMVRRMAVFCGVPTFLGISSFFVSYFLVTQGIELPTTAVLFVSLGLFGLGVLGLSYGALSTSWDEFEPGGLLGWQEFTLNLGRMKQAWQEARNQSN